MGRRRAVFGDNANQEIGVPGASSLAVGGSRSCSLDGLVCGLIDRFDEGEAAAGFATVADGFCVVGDGLEEVDEDGFVAAEVSYGCGGGALIGVTGGDGGEVGWRIAKIGCDDAVVLEDYGAFGTGDFDATWVAWICGRGGD
jgi:hypothetical protein